MMLAGLQIVLLLGTAWRLQSFDKRGCRYRPVVSLVATFWAGACLAQATALVLDWPRSLDAECALGTIAAGASYAAAIRYKGNVAELLRSLRLIDG